MVRQLLICYQEDLKENKIASEMYKFLREYELNPSEVVSKYIPKLKMFNVKYSFSKKEILPIPTLRRCLNKNNLLKKVTILNKEE